MNNNEHVNEQHSHLHPTITDLLGSAQKVLLTVAEKKDILAAILQRIANATPEAAASQKPPEVRSTTLAK